MSAISLIRDWLVSLAPMQSMGSRLLDARKRIICRACKSIVGSKNNPQVLRGEPAGRLCAQPDYIGCYCS